MKELVRLEIPNCNDRSELLAILAVAGYAVRQEAEKIQDRPWSMSQKYWVVVHKKEV